MLKRLLLLTALVLLAFSIKSQTVFYNSGITSDTLQEQYEEALFALMNSEQKKFFALAEEIIKADSSCFKIRAHSAMQTFKVTKGMRPFGDMAKLALDCTPKDQPDSTYFSIIETVLEDVDADVSDKLIALAESDPSVEIYYLVANHFVGKGDLKTAHKYFFRAFRLKNDFPPILSALAQTSEELGYEDLAADFLKRYMNSMSDNPKAHEIYGNYMAGKGDYEAAVDHFKKAYELDNSYFMALEKAKKLRGRFSEK